ncbi:MAG TPA: ABC transporter permease, partial [Algoriphagus sp.]|nr:ABC transporter permease [Algoriphagus sp.]
NIPLEEAKKLSRSRLIKNIIPLALGDNYKGYRIVGTNHDYLGLFEAQFDQGKVWEQPYEVVVGATVALREGL